MNFVFRRLLVSLAALHVICEFKLNVIIRLETKHMCVAKRMQMLLLFFVCLFCFMVAMVKNEWN